MTTIDCNTDNGELHLHVSGHAAYDIGGKDIVCSAISILCYTVLAVLEEAQGQGEIEALSHDFQPGDVQIDAVPKKKHARRVALRVDSILTGFRLLAGSYPEHVFFKVGRNP